MDAESTINVTGKGQLRGKGYYMTMGASYAGQGGTQDSDGVDRTYGTFFQEPDKSDLHTDQMGSGGGIESARGGGTIVIRGKNAILNGKVIANGYPSSTVVVEIGYHAGSGGYIYIACSDQPCNIKSDVTVNGGAGSDDQKSNAGSGGRIVLKNTQTGYSKYAAHGGCSNVPVSSSFNGAAGSVYFVDSKDLIYEHTNKCVAGMRSILDPQNINSENVATLKIFNQAILSFSNSRIVGDTMEVFINSIEIINATLTSPLQMNDQDLGRIMINIAHGMFIQNATLLNLAKNVCLNAESFDFDSNSFVKYHSSLVINATKSFKINGVIQQNDPTMGVGTNPIVIFYGGNITKADASYEANTDQVYLIDTDAVIRAFKIMMFSDQNITILGKLENVVEDGGGNFDIIGECQIGKFPPLNFLTQYYRSGSYDRRIQMCTSKYVNIVSTNIIIS
jgi:hypothetical protein